MRQVTAEGPVPVVEGRRIQVRGTVQGVGFRPFVYRLAREEGVSGCVRNEARGVTIEAFGTAPALDVFLRRIETDRPPAAEVREVCAEAIPADAAPGGFEIVASRGEGERRVSIPADLATCPECLAEVHDPRDRRHGYAFTNCTHCGPRYTIARDVPYDRAATTMAGFALCGELPARVRGPRRSPLPRAADGLPGVRAEAAAARAGGGGARGRRPAARGRGRLARRPHRRGEGPRRLPPGVRRDVVRRRAPPAREEEAGREAVRGDGARPRRRASRRGAGRRRGERSLACVERPIVLVRRRASLRPGRRGRARQPARRPPARLHAAARAAARGRRRVRSS